MMHSAYLSFGILITVFILCNGLCIRRYEYGVNKAEQDNIVNLHNQLRLLIANGTLPGQPRGVNLKRMYWDTALAQAAQIIANTCTYAHVKVPDLRWWSVGQNIAKRFSTNYELGANWTQVIYSWWNEHSIYKYPDASTDDTGHYTQLAWADTQFVGCGYTLFSEIGLFPYAKFYVCNYGPGGNVNGNPPYKTTGQSGCENLC